MNTVLVSLGRAADIVVDKPILLVGRSEDCDVVIDSKKVSRHHCCIAQVDDRLVVRDLGSTNGIRVNGERTDEGRLCFGDELAIGDQPFRVTREEGRVPTPESPARRGEWSDEDLEDADRPVPLSDSHVDERPPSGAKGSSKRGSSRKKSGSSARPDERSPRRHSAFEPEEK